ncbi:MAG: DUF2141 domain-containing protein [Paracoccaceae bacterium]
MFKQYGLVAATTLCAATNAMAADLTVRISGITSTAGEIFVALHDGAEGFPRDRKMVEGKRSVADPAGVTVVFTGLAAGDYAIAAFYDEDGDGELSTNLVGMPQEPFGFSQDARGSFGPPKFADAAVTVGAAGASTSITLAK